MQYLEAKFMSIKVNLELHVYQMSFLNYFLECLFVCLLVCLKCSEPCFADKRQPVVVR